MKIRVPLEPQGAKRPRVNSMINNAYYDSKYRKWLDEAMKWVEDYLGQTDYALVEELLGKDRNGNQYRNTHEIKGFRRIEDVEYKIDKERGKKVVKTKNVGLDQDGRPILDQDGYVISRYGQKMPILGQIRDDYLGIKVRIMFILPRRNSRKTTEFDRPFPVDSNTADIDNYTKAILDAFFETPIFKETGLNDRHIQSLFVQKRYVDKDEEAGILLEMKPL
ncbi:hypothetical protein FC36_GL000297 [Ligilactobacillus equi DSM 15833 = JCM 10991]|uniref:Uncharacterized protein n=2 Tax=Ligilactobacillus equi TaxID=137357 RepID=A0A0R1TR69_9LACO|nr:RusA family crossover junction endodeoxyribonuclease [Ligilactobacillus equi]KRL79771.1 hypothetical protein FC36_GL000297 [Ligilactobacillus equi DSM 15833 = JCM 10991]